MNSKIILIFYLYPNGGVVDYCLGGSDRVDVQSYHLNIVLAAAVGNAITASKVTARKNLGISSSTVDS